MRLPRGRTAAKISVFFRVVTLVVVRASDTISFSPHDTQVLRFLARELDLTLPAFVDSERQQGAMF